MKKKRFLGAVIVLALLISAAGCSSTSSVNENTTPFIDESVNDITTPSMGEKVTNDAEGETAESVGATKDIAEDYSFSGDLYDDAVGMTDYNYLADCLDVKGEVKADTADGAEKAESKTESEIDLPKAGLLTAGEWNDNDNWGFFCNLVNSGTIEFPSFGINPTNRTAVTVKNKDGSPLVNAMARLVDESGNILWSSVTNKQGVAYLFNQGDIEAVSVEIENGGKKQSFDLESSSGNEQSVKNTEGQDLEVTFDSEDKLFKQTDIMFIVDSTGSMADEMLFLQSEFTAIANEIGTNKTRYSVNFYRDEGDEYVTKCNHFTSDIGEIHKKLNMESADGGGDYPEAVADILKKTISDGGWNDEAVKIAFLIFDAPPHSGTEKTLLAAAQEASEKGIRIIPIVSSDSDRSTELFARSLAITTGGDYVFLTDDSGIGNSHMEPIIGSYEVRTLYDVIIGIINNYRQ